MDKLEFRTLEAHEIDCRIATINQKGLSLLLYKDARVDQNILDEKVGSMNWMRHHSRDNANCIVSIWDEDKQQWIEKEDTGTESFTEKEKGLASDSFKRACFNWGIGRELYTAPNMFVFAKDLKTLKKEEWQGKDKYTCKDSFRVTEIEYDNDKIVLVKVLNLKTNKEIEFGTPAEELKKQAEIGKELISKVKVTALQKRCEKDGVDEGKILKLYKVDSLAELTELKYANIHEHWEQIKQTE